MQQSEIKTVRPPRELADKVRVAFNSVTYYGQFHVGDRNSDLITRLPGLANRIIRRESFSPQQLATLKERIVEAGRAESPLGKVLGGGALLSWIEEAGR